MMKSRKLLVVDDHPVVLEGLRVVLSAQGYDVLKAVTADEALAHVAANEDIEVLVIDLTLRKDADGLDLIKKIRISKPGVPAVVYTMHEEMWNISTLIDSDVEGIVLKGEKIDELLEAVRLVGKGAIYRSPEFCERFDSVRKARGILSQTDMDVLRLISEGMPTGEISRKINLTEKSVEYHRSNIIKKLGSKNMTEAIRNAVKLGIITCMAGIATVSSYAADHNPQPVDLGLSVKWSDRNLGSPSPHAAGGYYSFGEVYQKINYDWPTYTLCEGGDMFSQLYIGDESICGTEYDAATYVLGKEWQLPSAVEVEELLASCSKELLEGEGRRFWRFSASNGAYIDIPLVGYMSKERLLYDNEEGSVWIGTFEYLTEEEDGFTLSMNDTYSLGLGTGLTKIIETSGHLGLPIRPVYVGQNGVTASEATETVPAAIYSIDGRRVSSASAPGLYIIDGKKILR